MNRIDVKDFIEMIASGSANLENHASYINSLNVFPVPDGDTGTNMSMTFKNGYMEALKCQNDNLSDVAKAFSRGLLMGARGNSGVITSQIFRGFYQYIADKESLSVYDFANGFENGTRSAYKAIMKPVEGTILTVVRQASHNCFVDLKNAPYSIKEYFIKFVNYGKQSLEKTPELLPALKQAGVVDAGGYGLVAIFEGFLSFLKGEPIIANNVEEIDNVISSIEVKNDEYGYCTEYILRINEEYKNFDENKLKEKLSALGESLVLVKDEDIIKVHVHTLKPGDALNVGQRYGEFIKLKIENMKQQHSSIIQKDKIEPVEEIKPIVKVDSIEKEEVVKDVTKENDNSENEEVNIAKSEETPRKKNAMLAVASGIGLFDLFNELNVDYLIDGGQTMNPSTQDFVDKIKDINADNIFVLPNNSNIILAAEQCANMIEDKNIYIIETKSIPEGIAAAAFFDLNGEVDENLNAIKQAISKVHNASITYAIKDTVFDGVNIKKGDYLALNDKKIVMSNKKLDKVAHRLIDDLLEIKNKELITIITGEGSNEKVTKKIEKYIKDYSNLEVQIVKGDQPVYAYLFGLE